MIKDVKINFTLPGEVAGKLAEAEGLFILEAPEIVRRYLRRYKNGSMGQIKKLKMSHWKNGGKQKTNATFVPMSIRISQAMFDFIEASCNRNRSDFISRVVSAGLEVDIPKAKRRHRPLSAQAVREIAKLKDCERYAANLRLELGC